MAHRVAPRPHASDVALQWATYERLRTTPSRVKHMSTAVHLAAVTEANLSGVVSGAVAGAMAGAAVAVSIRISRRSRHGDRTKGLSSPAVSVGDGHATVAGDHSAILQSFAPPSPPTANADTAAWITEVRHAAGSADHAYKVLNRADLAFEAAGGCTSRDPGRLKMKARAGVTRAMTPRFSYCGAQP